MNAERLEQLLRRADDFAPDSTPPRSARELAEAVRLRHRRRQTRRARTGAVAAMIVGCVALLGLLIHQRGTRETALSTDTKITPRAVSPTPAIDLEQAKTEFRRLVAEADRREVTAAALKDVTPSPRARLRSIDLQREEATLLLLHQGDALAHDPALRKSAAVAYRQAVDLFPETSGAAAAKQRLDTLN